MWTISLALIRNIITQIAWVGRSSCTCGLVPCPAARGAELWSLPPNVDLAAVLMMSLVKWVEGVLPHLAQDQVPDSRSLQLSAFILVCLSYALDFSHIWYAFQPFFTPFEKWYAFQLLIPTEEVSSSYSLKHCPAEPVNHVWVDRQGVSITLSKRPQQDSSLYQCHVFPMIMQNR